MSFLEFVETIGAHLKPSGAQIEQSRESPRAGQAWWITFRRAGCLYRMKLDETTSTLILERGQGSFVPNSPPTWRHLDSRQPVELFFEDALEDVKSLLARFDRRAPW